MAQRIRVVEVDKSVGQEVEEEVEAPAQDEGEIVYNKDKNIPFVRDSSSGGDRATAATSTSAQDMRFSNARPGTVVPGIPRFTMGQGTQGQRLTSHNPSQSLIDEEPELDESKHQ